MITLSIEGKNTQEIKRYSEVFWNRYEQLHDWQKIIKRIERGESQLQKIEQNNRLCQWKCKQYENAWFELK